MHLVGYQVVSKRRWLRQGICLHAIGYRVSAMYPLCAGCIFGSADQWASLRRVNPAQFAALAAYERRFGVTIHRRRIALNDLVDNGSPFAAISEPRITAALSATFDAPIVLPADVTWMLPAGAFGDTTGPD